MLYPLYPPLLSRRRGRGFREGLCPSHSPSSKRKEDRLLSNVFGERLV